MRWPWVSRRTLNLYRVRHAEQRIKLRDMEKQVDEARGARVELQDALRRSELERTDLNMLLLRITLGYDPFPALSTQEPSSVASAPSQDAPAGPAIIAGMSDAEIQRVFVQEAQGMYGSNMRKIRDHVEMRQAEYYQYRNRKPLLTEEEAAQAAAVAADVAAAIEEGRAAAESAK